MLAFKVGTGLQPWGRPPRPMPMLPEWLGGPKMKTIDVSTSKHPNTFALVDDEDFERINQHHWCLFNCRGRLYPVRWIFKKTVFMRREVLNHYGFEQVYCKNGLATDNRKENLIIGRRKDWRESFFKKIKIDSGSCWVWTGSSHASGYGQCWADKKQKRASRVSYEIHKGVIPEGLFVLHKCDNPICVNPDHLFLGNSQDNENDKVSKNRQSKGESHGMSKLSELQVREIISSLNYCKRSFLSKKYNVHVSTIHLIAKGIIWKHIPRHNINGK